MQARHKRGLALVTILLLTTLMLVVTACVLERVRYAARDVGHQEHVTQSAFVAEGGIHQALDRLTEDSLWTPAGGEFRGTPQGDVNFALELLNNYGGTLPIDATADHPAVPPGRVWMRSRGLFRGKAISGSTGQAQAYFAKPRPVFEDALVVTGQPAALSDPNGSTARIDSYDPAAGYQPPPGYVPRARAHVRCEHGVEAAGCFIDGSVKVPAATLPVNAPGATGPLVVDTTPQIPWVFRKPRNYPVPAFIPYENMAGAFAPSAHWDVIHSPPASPGNDLVLQPGDYYVHASFEVLTGARVRLAPSVTRDNPCKIYVGAQAIFAPNSRINVDNSDQPLDPGALQFYFCDGMYGYSLVRMEAGSIAACTFAGRNLRFQTVGACTLYGAARCEQLIRDPSSVLNLHYCENLGSAPTNPITNAGKPEWVKVNENHL